MPLSGDASQAPSGDAPVILACEKKPALSMRQTVIFLTQSSFPVQYLFSSSVITRY